MKILYCGAVSYYGGGPKAVVGIAGRLANDNEVEVVDAFGDCSDYTRSLKSLGLKLHVLMPEARSLYVGSRDNKLRWLLRIAKKAYLFYRLRRKIVKKIQEINPDVIWVNTRNFSLLIGCSFELRNYSILRSIIECPKTSSIRGLYKRFLVSRADAIVSVSSATAKVIQSVGVDKDKIHIVSDSIDADSFLRQSKLAIKGDLPGQNGYPKMILPAQILPLKSQDTAIRAVKNLVSKGFNPTLWLAGDVVGDDNFYIEYLHSLVNELGLANNVFFLGMRNDVPAIMNMSDIVVFPSQSEGFGLVALEGMLMHKPVITTPVGGLKDQIDDGINGLFFPVNDDGELAECIVRVVNDKKLCDNLVNNGYSIAVDKFNTEKNTKGYTSAFRAAMNNKIDIRRSL